MILDKLIKDETIYNLNLNTFIDFVYGYRIPKLSELVYPTLVKK